MASETLARCGIAVTVYDRMPSAGRKLLLAGRGGLSLTHSEPLHRVLARYGPAEPRLCAAIRQFDPAELRRRCEDLAQNTFIGTSGRVFPDRFQGFAPAACVARAARRHGRCFRMRHRWLGWAPDGRCLRGPRRSGEGAGGATVLALGRASWPRLGADGRWVDVLRQAGVAVARLVPTNCGFLAPWSETFRDRHAGQPLKRIALSFGAISVRGEVVITRSGLEGGAVYAPSARLRDAIAADSEALLHIDLRPELAAAQLSARLAAPRGKLSLSTFLRRSVKLRPAGCWTGRRRPAAICCRRRSRPGRGGTRRGAMARPNRDGEALVVTNSLPVDLLAQHFELQPFVLGGSQLRLGRRQRCRYLLEGRTIARIERRVGEPGLQRAYFLAEARDDVGQCGEGVFLIEAQAPPCRRGGSA
jgi:uncharacterized flavoprotein (TIGR03862 family)